jgi:TRAP transporter 4TM/12TM fusion protein
MGAGSTSLVWSVAEVRRRAAWLLGLTISLLAIYTAATGPFQDIFQRSVAVGLSVVLLLLAGSGAKPEGKRLRRWGGLAVDALLLVLAVLATAWFFYVHEALETGLYDLQPLDQAIGFGGLAALLELARRSAGLPLFVVGLLSIAYCLFGAQLPWILTHAGYGFEETLRTLWYSFDGVYGLPVAVVANMIVIFVVFGVVLEGTGAGAILLKIAFSLTGRLSGGPAHAAVVASGLFGTISGSPVGNVVGTGVFTMPMISRRGFSKAFAGAIEAAASSGGQFMPPVMGAVAFIMADLTGEPYLTICAAALVPAVFYYASLFCAVTAEASRLGIQPIRPEDREVLSAGDWVKSLMFVVPIAVILGILIWGRTPAVAGFWATVSAVVMGLILNPEFRRNPQRLVDTLAKAGRTAAVLIVAVGAIGVVIGMINLTGLGLRFSTLILSFAGDGLFFSLALMMLGSLVLGMGLPTVPAYLIIVLVMGPAIQQLGVPILITHLFVMYFGVLSNITPPVAIAAYAAAPICGANPLRVAGTAVRVALIGFVIPFVFVYEPALILTGAFDPLAFTWIALRLGLAIWLFTTAAAGICGTPIPLWLRVLRAACGIAALVPIPAYALAGTLLGLALVVQQRWAARRAAGPADILSQTLRQ